MTIVPSVRASAPLLAGALALCLTGCSLQTAGGPRGDVRLSATFDDVQSLVVGHSVQMSDVRIGTVTGIRLDGYRARVTMSLQNGRHIPTGTTATVAKTSLLGENYVRLNLPPGRDLRTGPFLANGALITQTSVAPDLEHVTQSVGPLLTALGGQDLATIVDTSSTAVAGKGRQLNRLIARAAQISDSYAAASDDLARTLDSLGRLGRTLSAGGRQIDLLPGNVLLATQRLRSDRARLKRSLQDLLQLGRSFNARIQERHAARLRTLLVRADAILASAVRGRQQLKTLAATIANFLRSPSVSYGGQALMLVWLKGFLPQSDGGAAPGAPAPDLTRLAAPR
jgi:phospholipid/cholesterol/gamma-HCH transport system substrate-binding protein